LSYALIGHEISDFSGIPVISFNQPHFSSKSIIIKRLFDFILSGIGLILISPILFFISIGVKLSSPGPVFFGQKRIGLDGKEFLMWKFRSMRVDSEANGAGWTKVNDPRKTKFGSFIRKTSLDELPQLWNVFIGEMSLVGPRPEQPFYVEKFRDEIPAYMLRHKMKAGITGWAQVNGWRGDTSIASRIECDIWYIKNWSIWLDFGILFMTMWKGIVNKNAY
jgi:putative colanic acid biosynthesis UDP-glucose lipid carrier transferase